MFLGPHFSNLLLSKRQLRTENEHGKNKKEIWVWGSRQQELLAQLHELILLVLRDVDSRSADLAIGLFDDVIDCSPGIMSRLQGISTQAGSRGAVTVPFELADIDIISLNTSEGQYKKPVISNIC